MRAKQAQKRKIAPDTKYNRKDISKFINYIMIGGKKTVAQKVVYGALDIIEQKTKKDPILTYDEAFKKVSPAVEVRGRRVGGANYQVPFPVREERKLTLASRWIIEAAKKVKGKPMAEKLADVLLQSAIGEGPAIKKKEDVHRMAESNKAFAHFAKFG